MGRKPKFKPVITRVKLNPEQAVLTCDCYNLGNRGFITSAWWNISSLYPICAIGSRSINQFNTCLVSGSIGVISSGTGTSASS